MGLFSLRNKGTFIGQWEKKSVMGFTHSGLISHYYVQFKDQSSNWKIPMIHLIEMCLLGIKDPAKSTAKLTTD